MPYFTHHNVKYILDDWHGTRTLREEEPIDVAIFNHEQDPTKWVILHPRYASKKGECRIEKVVANRRGRTLDVFFDRPVKIDGKNYHILNYKGTGADTHESMVFAPGLWWTGTCWENTHDVEKSLRRIWGGLRTSDGEAEYNMSLTLEKWGMTDIKHVGINPLPNTIMNEITHKKGISHRKQPLCQLVRACPTNIRMSDGYDMINSYIPSRENERVNSMARFDLAYLMAQLELAAEGKTLDFLGDISDNRLSEGSFLDGENYSIKELPEIREIGYNLREVFRSIRICAEQKYYEGYFKEFLSGTKRNKIDNHYLRPRNDPDAPEEMTDMARNHIMQIYKKNFIRIRENSLRENVKA